MADHDVLDRTERDHDEHAQHDERTAAYVDFLEAEFPEWEFQLDRTETWSGDPRQLWIATRDGHHPQSALTAAKLHRRLEDYESRHAARFAGAN